MAPAVAGGFVTAWGELDNALALPALVDTLTGRPFLGTMPGTSEAKKIPEHVIAQILRASEAQRLDMFSNDLLPSLKKRREEWHAMIRGQV
jgi:hypothetical protein